MLKIKDLFVSIDGHEILKGINLSLGKGDLVVIFGPNGCGKTTLLKVIMGISGSKIQKGEVFFKGKKINNLAVDKRALMGIGMMYQKAPKLKGVKLDRIIDFLGKKGKQVEKYKMEKFLGRSVNDNLSGGEIKRSELLQLRLQSPDLLLLDEPDSGVDVENIALVGKEIKKMVKEGKSAIIITHTGQILKYLKVKMAYVMMKGRIVCHDEAKKMLATINANGYNVCVDCKKHDQNC
jgi:Fe-S cluster assembly ATP-binding protein